MVESRIDDLPFSMRSFRRYDIVPYPSVFFRSALAQLVRCTHVLRCMFLGLDLGTSSVKAALVDASGDIAAVTHQRPRSDAGLTQRDALHVRATALLQELNKNLSTTNE
jgi:hypothetical protein